ncbi:ATP-binding protein [Acidimicrobiia bacterium]|nr:ATP-binding protein [Porticoccaceae bacterium]MDC0978376.1 ATP-binding protein [Acidimicrobiia bacterium]MDC1477249.1 ATP-binding protein [Porticoccaceae bacterium]
MSTAYEDVTPSPVDLIRSIAEQGYTLQASLADLVDNSISANATAIDILVCAEREPFKVFIADNGVGMSEHELSAAMRLPSQSPLDQRRTNDLGRFGLGMKTASFAQTRRFTVLSKKAGEQKYSGRTWDLSVLEQGEWKIVVNSRDEITKLLSKYREESRSRDNELAGFEANTLVIWDGLHKFEEFISEQDRESTLNKEIKEVTAGYLSIVFHRFIERSKHSVRLRLNNVVLPPFNPFPIEEKDLREIEPLRRSYNNDTISVTGYILPSRAISESRGASKWTTKHLSLIDMEGMYIYRSDRLISFGGWSSLAKKTARHNLARLRVDIGNNSDLHLHLNVAKSQFKIPDDLRPRIASYIKDLKEEAYKEYHNRSVRRPADPLGDQQDFLKLVPTSNGSVFEINHNFPLYKLATKGITKHQKTSMKTLLRMLLVKLNLTRRTSELQDFGTQINDDSAVSEAELRNLFSTLKDSGVPREYILKHLVPDLGFEKGSIPTDILKILD